MLVHKPQTYSSPSPIAVTAYSSDSHSQQLVSSQIPQLPTEGKLKEGRDVNARTSAGKQLSLFFRQRKEKERDDNKKQNKTF